MNTNPAGRIASIHSGQKPPRSTTFLRPHQVRPGAERAVHTPHCNSHKARCQPVRTTYSQVTALLTLDNRALHELGALSGELGSSWCGGPRPDSGVMR